jgi:hypothetical protein
MKARDEIGRSFLCSYHKMIYGTQMLNLKATSSRQKTIPANCLHAWLSFKWPKHKCMIHGGLLPALKLLLFKKRKQHMHMQLPFPCININVSGYYLLAFKYIIFVCLTPSR